MPMSEQQGSMSLQTRLDWNDIKSRLEQEKAMLYTQIGNYPPPIAACDQQFNHLLAKQKLVMQELAQLSKAKMKA